MGIHRRIILALGLSCFTWNIQARLFDPKIDSLEVLEDFSYGLNTQQAPHKLDKRASPNIKNAYVDEQPFSIVGRNGMRISGSCPYLSKINFGVEQVFDDGSRKLYVSDSSQVYVTADQITWTLVRATLTTTAQLRAVQGRGFMLFTNGVDPVFISSGLLGIVLDGTGGNANAPRGKYVAFYQERFFIANTTSNRSALNWMALSSTAGYAIPITSGDAWPMTNQLNIGQGDGSVISGLDVFKGQLQIHKFNRSIYTLYGTDETNYFARRTNANSGSTSQESIVQIDNLEYYYAKDGNNAFDSADSVRISDDILPDMQAISNNLSNIQTLTWDTKAQFDVTGSSFIYSTSTAGGELRTVPLTRINTVGADPSISSAVIKVSDTDPNTEFAVFTTTEPIPDSFLGYISTISIYARATVGDVLSSCSVKNERTGEIDGTNGGGVNINLSVFDKIDFGTVEGNPVTQDEFSTHNALFTKADLENGNLKIQFSFLSGAAGSYFEFYPSTKIGYASITLQPVTTGQYISQQATATNITTWDTFESNYNSNGGAITFYIKAATSLVQLPGEPYQQINPGNAIPFNSSRTYVQWTSTFIAHITTQPVSIGNVSIRYNIGGAADSDPKSIEWKKRYLMLCSSVTDGSVSTMYVKSKISNSKPNAWTQFTFANDYFKSIFRFNDNLYLGSGSTGTIYRFDYGTNDDGSPINFVYQTPGLSFGNLFFESNLYEYMIDAEKQSGSILTVGTSVDGGAYDDLTLSLGGSGHYLGSLDNVSYSGKTISLKLSNSQLDKQITIHGIGIVNQKTRIH